MNSDPSPALRTALRDYVQHKGDCKIGSCKRCGFKVDNHANLYHMGYGACCDKNNSTEAYDCTCGLAALLDAAPPSLEWQPIETAPKEQVVLVHDDGYVGKGMLANGEWLDVEVGTTDAIFDPSPTHWMPLPAAPPSREQQ